MKKKKKSKYLRRVWRLYKNHEDFIKPDEDNEVFLLFPPGDHEEEGKKKGHEGPERKDGHWIISCRGAYRICKCHCGVTTRRLVTFAIVYAGYVHYPRKVPTYMPARASHSSRGSSKNCDETREYACEWKLFERILLVKFLVVAARNYSALVDVWKLFGGSIRRKRAYVCIPQADNIVRFLFFISLFACAASRFAICAYVWFTIRISCERNSAIFAKATLKRNIFFPLAIRPRGDCVMHP